MTSIDTKAALEMARNLPNSCGDIGDGAAEMIKP